MLHKTKSSRGWVALFMLAAIALRVGSTSTANLSYLLIAAYALLGRAQAIQALALSWLFGMLSLGIAPEATAASVGRYAVIAAAAASVFLRSVRLGESFRVSRMTLATVLLGVFLISHSILFSPIADVSILKAISWSVVTATLFAAWGGLNEEARACIATQIFGGLVVIFICSLPLLALPQLGYLRNGTGFQGILNHPQGFGPTMALLGTWAGARMIGEQRPPWSLVLLVGACVVLVVLSESRTAGVGMVLGLAAAVALVPWLSRRPVRAMLPGLMTRRVYLVASVVVLGAVLSGATLQDRFGAYLDKGSRVKSTSLADAYDQSRGTLIDNMWDNISLYPFTGIGFGIASQPDEMIVMRDPVLGVPTGAAIEKGVLPIAVVEELGVFGAAVVLAWLWIVVYRASRASVTALALVLTTVMLNFGESTFFSPGGFGLLPLILLTWAATAKPDRVGVNR